MRSTLDNVITGFSTTDALRQQQLENYITKATMDHHKVLDEIAENRKKMKEIVKKVPMVREGVPIK